MDGEEKSDRKKIGCIKIWLTMFESDGTRLLYQVNVFVLRSYVSNIFEMAYECKISGHFGLYKTIFRLDDYH